MYVLLGTWPHVVDNFILITNFEDAIFYFHNSCNGVLFIMHTTNTRFQQFCKSILWHFYFNTNIDKF
jgi:hypothetical protein